MMDHWRGPWPAGMILPAMEDYPSSCRTVTLANPSR